MCIAGGRIIDFEAALGNQSGAQRSPVRTAAYEPHSHLFFEGDPRTSIHIVERGWAKLYRTLIDGQRQVVGFANEGSVLGLESMADHRNSCEAITDVVTRVIPVSQFADYMSREPDTAAKLIQQLGAQLDAAQAQLVTIGTQSAEQKLASFLLAMSRQGGDDRTDEFDLPMRRGEMAEFLGLRLETISRKMSEFQRRGWIRMTTMYRCRLLQRGILSHLAEGSESEGVGLTASV